MSFVEDIKGLEEEIIKWRRWFHQHPGVGFDVEETTNEIKKKLREIGYRDIKRYAQTGVVAYLENHKDFKTVAIRADIDALPILEENNVEYISKYPGKMHGCGHDAHAAMALGAAKYLYLNKEKLGVNVLFIFQPGEEGYGGAEAMLKEGLFEDYPYDYVFGCHIGLIFPELDGGQIGISYEPIMAATREFEVAIKGFGGHGAMPQNTVDPIVIAANIITSVQTIVSRNLAPTDTAIVTFGSIQGGTAHNIIPEQVNLAGTIRYLNEESGSKIETRFKEILEGVSKAYGGEFELVFKSGYPAVVNNGEMVNIVKEKLIHIFPEDDIIELKKPTMGGEDMSYFLERAPGCFFFLGGANEEKGITYPHHHPKFNVDEGILWKGTAAFCQLVLNISNI